MTGARACVFPGQGAQAVGMGEGLFAQYPEMTAAADAILGYSVAELCLEDPRRQLHQTQYTQPALYVVNALSYRRRCDSGAPRPDFVAGHSLGEYNALLAAEVFDFETGLRLVNKRGELMSEASGGAMAAVLGYDAEKVEAILLEKGLRSLEVANYNTPTQVVLSGSAEDILRAEAIFCEIGATYTPLNVSAAFHSRFMEAFVQPLGETLEGAVLQPPKIPVISNVSARPYGPDDLRDHLRRQIREPVRWTETIRYLLKEGVQEFEEVGPGSVLTKLIRSIRKRSAPPATPGLRADTAPAAAITAERLGAETFLRDYQVRRAYAAGSMPWGIASKELVVQMGRAGYLGFFGAGGLEIHQIEEGLASIRSTLTRGEPFGVSLVSSPDAPESEMAVVDRCLHAEVRVVEAIGYVVPSPALVRYRLKGHKVIVKVSRPEVAETFLNPPPEHVVTELLRAGLVSASEAKRARRIPMADDLCLDSDSGGVLASAAVLLPSMIRQRDDICRLRGYEQTVRVGTSGEIGTPEAAASAFLLGADFILTDWINQCTVEAATSDVVKDLLQTMDVHDTEHAPAAELFELGAKVRVLKKGVLFPGRANRLYELWKHHGSWDEIDAPTRSRIEHDFLGRSFERAYEEVRSFCSQRSPQEIEKAERDERHKMALVFRWYLDHALRLALSGTREQRKNFQVPCSSSLGALNQWVRGTKLETWRQRHVDVIADRLMEGAAEVLNRRWSRFAAPRTG